MAVGVGQEQIKKRALITLAPPQARIYMRPKCAVEGEWEWALTAKMLVQGHANPKVRILTFC